MNYDLFLFAIPQEGSRIVTLDKIVNTPLNNDPRIQNYFDHWGYLTLDLHNDGIISPTQQADAVCYSTDEIGLIPNMPQYGALAGEEHNLYIEFKRKTVPPYTNMGHIRDRYKYYLVACSVSTNDGDILEDICIDSFSGSGAAAKGYFRSKWNMHIPEKQTDIFGASGNVLFVNRKIPRNPRFGEWAGANYKMAVIIRIHEAANARGNAYISEDRPIGRRNNEPIINNNINNNPVNLPNGAIIRPPGNSSNDPSESNNSGSEDPIHISKGGRRSAYRRFAYRKTRGHHNRPTRRRPTRRKTRGHRNHRTHKGSTLFTRSKIPIHTS